MHCFHIKGSFYRILARIRSVLDSAHPPVLISVVTQGKTWIALARIPLFHPHLAGNALRVYARGYSIQNGRIQQDFIEWQMQVVKHWRVNTHKYCLFTLRKPRPEWRVMVP